MVILEMMGGSRDTLDITPVKCLPGALDFVKPTSIASPEELSDVSVPLLG